MANRLPFEIWLRVTEFLTPAESTTLYGVNRALFEIVMNARYRVLDLTRLDDDLLDRLPLLKDPAVSKRVRHLSISGVALQNSLLSTVIGEKVTLPMNRKTLQSINRRARALDVTTVLNGQVRLISEIISALNVSEYSVKWEFREGIQSSEIIHAALQAAILDAVWPKFGSNLRKISISTRPEKFNAVVSSDVDLVRLEEIHLELTHPSNGPQAIGIQDLFPEYVSSFFARVSPRLETLSIQSSSSLDLSCLLHRLPSFTHLHRLLLHIFLDHDVVSDPSGLEDFFAHSALELRHLTLFLYHAAVASVERVLPSLAMARARVPSLETLEINFGMPYPGLASSLHLELHSVFNGARNTLHTLVLEGIALSYVDLETLMSAFADREADDILRSVTLSTLTLTPTHIDMLARNLPRVSTLGIIFMNLSLIPDGPAENESECRAYFKKEIRERKYPGWKLYDLSIWHRDRSVDTSRWDLVSSFPECIPTIVRFFGHPLPQTSRSQGAQRLLHSVPTI